MKKFLFILSSSVLLFSSCKKYEPGTDPKLISNSSISEYQNEFLEEKVQKYSINASNLATITTDLGNKIIINPNSIFRLDGSSVSGDVDVRVIELTSKADLMKSGIASNTTDNKNYEVESIMYIDFDYGQVKLTPNSVLIKAVSHIDTIGAYANAGNLVNFPYKPISWEGLEVPAVSKSKDSLIYAWTINTLDSIPVGWMLNAKPYRQLSIVKDIRIGRWGDFDSISNLNWQHDISTVMAIGGVNALIKPEFNYVDSSFTFRNVPIGSTVNIFSLSILEGKMWSSHQNNLNVDTSTNLINLKYQSIAEPFLDDIIDQLDD